MDGASAVPATPLHHAAAAQRADHHGLHPRAHLQLQDLRPGVRHDAGRTGGREPDHHHAAVRHGLQILPLRRRLGHGGVRLRHADGGDACCNGGSSASPSSTDAADDARIGPSNACRRGARLSTSRPLAHHARGRLRRHHRLLPVLLDGGHVAEDRPGDPARAAADRARQLAQLQQLLRSLQARALPALPAEQRASSRRSPPSAAWWSRRWRGSDSRSIASPDGTSSSSPSSAS